MARLSYSITILDIFLYFITSVNRKLNLRQLLKRKYNIRSHSHLRGLSSLFSLGLSLCSTRRSSDRVGRGLFSCDDSVVDWFFCCDGGLSLWLLAVFAFDPLSVSSTLVVLLGRLDAFCQLNRKNSLTLRDTYDLVYNKLPFDNLMFCNT